MLGLLIGGFVPAVMFTVSNIAAKAAVKEGIGIGAYIATVGLGVVLTGVMVLLLWPERAFSLKSGGISLVFGMSWGIGIGCAGFAIARYNSSIGQLASIFNMNTLFTVLIALWLFSEWKQVKPLELIIGSLLIVIGSIIVARA